MDNDLSVAHCTEAVAESPQLLREFDEVVHLAVVDDDHTLILVEQRLMSAGEIDDREAAVTEAYSFANIEAIPIGAAVTQGIGHGDKELAIDWPSISGVKNACQ